MAQDVPGTRHRRFPATMQGARRVAVRFVPIVGWGLTIYEVGSLIDGAIPDTTQIQWMIDDLNGRAGEYAWSGEIIHGAGNGVNTGQLINQYWGQPSLPMRLQANAARSEILADTARQVQLQALPTGNEALAEALRDRANTTIGHINSAVANGDEAQVQEILDEYRAESARQEEEFRQANASAPPTSEVTEGNVSIVGQCRPIRLCFWPSGRYRNNTTLRREYERQLANQERGLNAMAPADVVSNR